MAVSMRSPGPLRTTAAVLLGAIIGSILFFIVALVIGSINDIMGMNIPFNLKFAENIWSTILLVFFIGVSVAIMYYFVLITPPTEEEPEISDADIPDPDE